MQVKTTAWFNLNSPGLKETMRQHQVSGNPGYGGECHPAGLEDRIRKVNSLPAEGVNAREWNY